jgi:molybdate transport system ATP-binding protein
MTLDIDVKLTRSDNFALEIKQSIPDSGLTAVYGPSGSGKTTLLRCIAGLEKGTANDRIWVDFNHACWQGENCFVPAHKRGIGYVFQDAKLIPHLNVKGNLDYAVKRRRSDRGQSLADIIEWLSLAPLLGRPVQKLSGGEKQRVAIGRVLATGPELVLMDEPLSSLDQPARAKILPFLNRLHGELAIPIVYVTHSLEEITYLADRMILIDAGQITASGSVFDMTNRLDLDISHEESAGSLLICTVSHHDDQFDLSELTFDGGKLFVARQDEEPGSRIRVRIPARDVSITLSADNHSSILNILEATIEAIEDTDNARVLVRLNVGTSVLLARITRKSRHHLDLHPGQQVYAQIKSVALLTETQEQNHES